MVEELPYFNSTVWQAVDINDAKHTTDYKLIRTRWVVCNKGDLDHPDVRARLVACEVGDGKNDAFFSATQPLEAKKMLFSMSSSKRWTSTGKPLELSFVDIKKAYFNAVPARNLHVQIPKELDVSKDKLAFLKRCVYGTRDAGLLWEDTYATCLESLGFIRGVPNPC